MTKAAIVALEKALIDESNALARDQDALTRFRMEMTNHEKSVQTRTANILQLKHALESLRELT